MLFAKSLSLFFHIRLDANKIFQASRTIWNRKKKIIKIKMLKLLLLHRNKNALQIKNILLTTKRASFLHSSKHKIEPKKRARRINLLLQNILFSILLNSLNRVYAWCARDGRKCTKKKRIKEKQKRACISRFSLRYEIFMYAKSIC